MTCEQLGGPCATTFRAGKADDIIKAQDKHLRAAVAGGDEAHGPALASMRDRWKHPIAGMGWYRETKKTFAALPED